MQVKLLLTLLIITLITIAIICGCGGGSGTTQPASLVTPTPDYTDTDTGDTAYITVRVKWPEQGKTGNISTVSKNGKELTTSMIPPGTKIIDIYVIDYTDNPNNPNIPWDKVVAAGNIHEGEIEKTIPVTAVKVIGKPTPGAPNQGSTGPPPAIYVKILAEAFSEFNENDPTRRNHEKQVAHTDLNVEPIILKVGNQEHKIKLLLNPTVKVEASESTTARSIIVSDTGSSNEYDINANLQLMYGTPFPVSTPMGNSSGKTSEPMEGQTVKFKIIQGSGQLDATQAETDPNGDCKVHFTSASAYNVIEASYQYDPDDPNTIVTSQCTIGDNYIIRFAKIEPDTHRPYGQSGSLTSTLNTELLLDLPDDPNETPVPISNKVINFTIVNPVPNGSGYTVTNELSSNNATTTTTGLCDKDIIYKYTWSISNSTHGTIPQTYVIIRATYTSENGNTYNADAKINIWGIMWRNNIFKIINPQDL